METEIRKCMGAVFFSSFSWKETINREKIRGFSRRVDIEDVFCVIYIYIDSLSYIEK